MTRSIKDLVSKYQSLEPSDRKIKRAVRKAIEIINGVEIPETHIHIQHTVAFLTLHPIEKKEILKKTNLLLLEIEKLLGSPVIKTLK